jgi:hypothetical protein
MTVSGRATSQSASWHSATCHAASTGRPRFDDEGTMAETASFTPARRPVYTVLYSGQRRNEAYSANRRSEESSLSKVVRIEESKLSHRSIELVHLVQPVFQGERIGANFDGSGERQELAFQGISSSDQRKLTKSADVGLICRGSKPWSPRIQGGPKLPYVSSHTMERL